MALQRVTFQTKKYVPTYACSPVALCLTDAWADQTASGLAILIGTVQNTGRVLGRRGNDALPPPWENPRADALFQYEITVDDTQILDDPETEEPFVLDCADIVDISADACLWEKFIAFAED